VGEVLKRRLKQEKFNDTLHEAILNILVVAGHIRERLDRYCESYGITPGQYNVLRILRGVYPNGHPRGEIAARMVERAPDVTRLIDRLENQRLVERDRSRKDRRLSITRITKRGLELLDRMDPDREMHKHFGERISQRDRRDLSRICEELYGPEE